MEERLGDMLVENTSLFDYENIEALHHINQALKAHYLFRRDVDYVVQDNPGGDRRRIHRKADAGTALQRRTAPGSGNQGKCHHRTGKPDPGGDHLPELLPALQ